jgi:dihydrofolate reductase
VTAPTPHSKLALIVAMTADRVIGKDGGIPWRLPDDLRHFRDKTMGHAIVMGRSTHESIGRALPGRRNIVVTRQRGKAFDGCEVAHSFEEAIALARETDDEPFVIGGAALYAAALPFATTLHITFVHRDVEGDTFFPELDLAPFDEVERREAEGATFVTYARR